MPQTKPVVVATDGSDHSLRVLPHASLIAFHLGAPIEFVRVVERDDVRSEPGQDEAAALARAQSRFESEMSAALQRAGLEGDVSVVIAPATESPAQTLLGVASQAQLLVMHSRGRGGLALLLQGSVALGVLKGVDVPVMIGGPELLPPPVDGGSFNLLVTTDLSPDADQGLRGIAPLVERGRFRVTLAYIHLQAPAGLDNEAIRAGRQAELEGKRALLPPDAAVETVIRQIPIGGGIDTAIMEVAADVGAHAIAMATHGHSARHSLLVGSTALSVLRRSGLPVIAVRARDQATG